MKVNFGEDLRRVGSMLTLMAALIDEFHILDRNHYTLALKLTNFNFVYPNYKNSDIFKKEINDYYKILRYQYYV